MVVFGIDEQWTADLIEVINISKQNKACKYLLTVVDVFSKYAWVEPIKPSRTRLKRFSIKAEPQSIYRPMMEKSFTIKHSRVC